MHDCWPRLASLLWHSTNRVKGGTDGPADKADVDGGQRFRQESPTWKTSARIVSIDVRQSFVEGERFDDLSYLYEEEHRDQRMSCSMKRTTLWLSLLLICAFVTPTVGQCNLCVNGEDPVDTGLTINGFNCQIIASSFRGELDPDRCRAVQATYGVYCGCAGNVEATEASACRLCPNESLLPDPGLQVPEPDGLPVGNCLALEFAASIGTDVTCPDARNSAAADLCCAGSTPFPTGEPTGQPSAGPTISPTWLPTLAPTNTPTSTPTSTPTQSPTAGPTGAPTTGPSGAPVVTPTLVPTTEAPVGLVALTPTIAPATDLPTADDPTVSTLLPTALPTVEPTDVPTRQVGESFQGITLRLPGVEMLDENAQDNFESALQGWYAAIYEEDGRRSLRRQRHLQEDGLDNFQTRVLYMSQALQGNDTVVTYDQSLSFVQKETDDEVDVRNLLLEPFDDPAMIRQLTERLQASDDAFASLDAGDLISPIVPQAEGPDESDGGSDLPLGIILGAAAGGLTVVGLIFYFAMSKSSKKGNGTMAPAQTQSLGEKLAADERRQEEEYPEFSTDPSPTKSTPDVEEQSIPTVDYEYTQKRGEVVSLSSAGGTVGQKTNDSGTWMGVLGLDAGSGDGQESTALSVRTDFFEVTVPPGKLGVVIDTPIEGPPQVFAVKEGSPLFGKVLVGDNLLKVDDDDVSMYSAVKVSKLIGRKAKEPTRKFTMSRSTSSDQPVPK
jgi:hypothetical protein